MATKANAASAQGMLTNVTAVQHQNVNTVLNNVRTLAEAHHKTSIMLVAGLTQFLLVRAYHPDDNERWKLEQSRDYLKAQLNERGLKQAMIYRYIATAVALGQAIVKPGIGNALLSEIFLADNEQKAHKAIMRMIERHEYLFQNKPKIDWLLDAEKKPRLSLDVLRVNLELDELDKTKQPGYVAPVVPAGAGLTPATPTVPATKAKPASIIARLKADKDMVKALPVEIVTSACDVIGREKMAERLVSLMTAEECAQLLVAVNTRMQELAKVPAPAPDTKADAPAGDAPQTEQTAEPTTRRSNPRKRKAA